MHKLILLLNYVKGSKLIRIVIDEFISNGFTNSQEIENFPRKKYFQAFLICLLKTTIINIIM